MVVNSRRQRKLAASRPGVFRPVCSTAVVDIKGDRLRVAWTSSGIVSVERESLREKERMQRRTGMEFIETAFPPALREALADAAKSRTIEVPIDLSWAREFEREVLFAARQIPFGETRSYSWLARAARRPLAIRAAASIMARNPLWLLVPCHRVIYANGKIGPYGPRGNKRKCQLLAREGIELTKTSSKRSRPHARSKR